MLVYSFVCSIIFTIVMITFIISSFYYCYKKKKLLDESKELLNGFDTFDLDQVFGGVDDKNKKE